MAEKFKPALLGKDGQLGKTLLLWPDPWPDRQTIKSMIRVVIPSWENLLKAQQFINIRAIKEEVQAIEKPPDPIVLVRDQLYGGPLSDQQLPEQQAISEVQTDWTIRKKDVDDFISKANILLDHAAQAETHRKQVITLFNNIRKLRQQKFKDWKNFIAAVHEMDREIIQYPGTLSKPFHVILDKVRQEQQANEAKLEQLVDQFKREIGSNVEYRNRAAERLRQLANDLASSNLPEDEMWEDL
jgi:hypothetical protein